MSQGVQRLASHGGCRWLPLLFWLALVAAVALTGSAATLPNIPIWYAGLAKPSFTPPNWLFGRVWTVLYVMMAVAVWRIGAVAADRRRGAIALFALQLALNALWSPVFFGLHAPISGLVIIAALVVALAACTILFWRIDRVAGLLLAPYLVWVCYATALNAAIVALN